LNPKTEGRLEAGATMWDSPEITIFLNAALDEDIGAGDLTARALIAVDARARAQILARRELVAAGLPLAERVFRALDPETRVEVHFAEGDAVPANGVLAHIECRARALLTGERTALNLLSHLCGVATLTRAFVRAVSGTNTKIRDTRKTLPLLRRLEKYAVRMGGGVNHRMGLYDAMLIKENHIASAGGVRRALERARAFLPSPSGEREATAYESFAPPAAPGWDEAVPIQIEVRNEAELREALAAGADSLLLDNLTPAEAARLVALSRKLRAGCVLELSGGVTLENARAYGEAGADFIAVGALTHSAPAADLSLLVESARRA
jgi:nicotinate-nucleotide pyrophosphorylase (carboxylating)